MRHWTLEERQRQSNLIRRWKPWEQSTGPKTLKGKTIVAQNGYKGGIRESLRALSSVLKNQQAMINGWGDLG